MEETTDVCGIREAYKWLFISASFGHLTASKGLLDVMLLMGDDESDDAYELVLEWYDKKFDDSRGEDQRTWSLELLRLRFGDTLLN